MSQGLKIRLGPARNLAAKLIISLKPACQRIRIAGSIRRKKPMVGDIEIVAIPRYRPKNGSMTNFLTGEIETESLLDSWLETLLADKPNLRPHPQTCWGPRNKRFQVCIDRATDQWLTVDLFITTAEIWGLTYLLRTGPADFSKRVVTIERHGGRLPNELQIADGVRRRWDNTLIPTPHERDFFKLVGYDVLRPWERG